MLPPDYARQNGYDLIVDYEANSPRGTMWQKFDMIERVIRAGKHDWVWWIDFDTLYMNTTARITDVIHETVTNTTNPDGINMIFTRDWFVSPNSLIFQIS